MLFVVVGCILMMLLSAGGNFFVSGGRKRRRTNIITTTTPSLLLSPPPRRRTTTPRIRSPSSSSSSFVVLLLPSSCNHHHHHHKSRRKTSRTTIRSSNNNNNNNNNDDDVGGVGVGVGFSFWSRLLLSRLDKKLTTEEEEEVIRLKIWSERRIQIRKTLKVAESLRFVRERATTTTATATTANKNDSSSKTAISITAFMIAAGVIVLRIGGRTALMSLLGLDFIVENEEMKNNMNQVLDTLDETNEYTKLGLFILGWILVKVLCFDTGGIVLALSSGIIFDGVVRGTIISVISATIGSCICFILARFDTPIRTKALDIIEEYPSLRGIERVVAKDGFKAIVTLRLAPILPIPLGMYNYIYGVTNVPLIDFVCGIFVGSLKPYFLDSYLGYFGKSIMETSSSSIAAADGGATAVATTNGSSSLQDFILLGTLGISVLIGVFASQLANETWDTVLTEIKQENAEKRRKKREEEEEQAGEDDDDAVVIGDQIKREVFGYSLPSWSIQLQETIRNANELINDVIVMEYQAKAWNITTTTPLKTSSDVVMAAAAAAAAAASSNSGSSGNSVNDDDTNKIIQSIDPSKRIISPEIQYTMKRINFVSFYFEELLLTINLLFHYFWKYSDPTYYHYHNNNNNDADENDDDEYIDRIHSIQKREKELLLKMMMMMNKTFVHYKNKCLLYDKEFRND